MDFDLSEYIKYIGFAKTRDSDKRDIFEMDYYHPLIDKTYKAVITIYYDSGYSKYNSYSVWLMTLELLQAEKLVSTLFNGLAPSTFDQAKDLFELTMPTPEFLKSKDI